MIDKATDADFIWATRGRDWGFRFLRNGGQSDPLSIYESAFSEMYGDADYMARHVDFIALRFGDPEGRRDAAGRLIPHEFVLLRHLRDGVITPEDAKRKVWPAVATEYASIWDEPRPFG